MASIRALCKTGVLLENGSVVYRGDIDSTVEKYLSLNDDNLVGTPLAERLDRKGNGVARFTSMQMLIDGKPQTQLPMAKPVDFELKLNAKKDIKNASLMYSVYNSLGVIVTSSNSRFVVKDAVNIPKGEHTFKIHYDNLPLSIGIYKINIRLWDEDEQDVDWVEGAFMFEVTETDIYNTGKFYKDSSSLIVLPHTIQLG